MALPIIKDQLNREIRLNEIPMRIVSLVPSLTELLIFLGLQDRVVGVTEYCPDVINTIKVGGTKNFSCSKIKALQPHLIIACKEENSKCEIEELATLFPVWIADIDTLENALHAIEVVGILTDKDKEAKTLSNEIRDLFHSSVPENKRMPDVAYLIWRKPYMTVGGDTFISDMITKAGFNNLYRFHSRYPEITLPELALLKPEFIFLSSEPFPFAQKHMEEFQNYCPQSKIVLVKGEYFSWYGSRLLESYAYFKKLRMDLLI